MTIPTRTTPLLCGSAAIRVLALLALAPAVLPLLIPTLHAQRTADGSSREAAQSVDVLLSELGRLAGAKSADGGGNFVVRGRVEVVGSEDANRSGMRIMVSGGRGGTPFEGEFEGIVAAGMTFVRSQSPLPGVVAMTNGRRSVVRVTSDPDRQVGHQPLSRDAVHLLDFGRLREEVALAVSDGKVEAKAGADGATLFSLPARAGLIQGAGEGFARMMQPRVLGIDVVFTVDANGILKGSSFDVVRSDPTAKLRERAMAQGGTITVRGSGGDLDEGEPVEGETTRLTFAIAPKGASDAAVELFEELSVLLAD